MNKILLIVIASFLLIACSNIGNKQDKWPPNCYPKKQLPYGNINRDKELNNDFKQYKNTENDEIAPVQISKILNLFLFHTHRLINLQMKRYCLYET